MKRKFENISYISAASLFLCQQLKVLDEVSLAFIHDFIVMLIVLGFIFEGVRVAQMPFVLGFIIQQLVWVLAGVYLGVLNLACLFTSIYLSVKYG